MPISTHPNFKTTPGQEYVKMQPTGWGAARNTRSFSHPLHRGSPFSKSPKPGPHLAFHSYDLCTNACVHVTNCSSPIRPALTPPTPRALSQLIFSHSTSHCYQWLSGSMAAAREALDPAAGLNFALPCPQPMPSRYDTALAPTSQTYSTRLSLKPPACLLPLWNPGSLADCSVIWIFLLLTVPGTEMA